ncbi:MAG: hypothetical protein OXI74_14110 [Rhodospirillaceae bacterium]|nr:hypothetical protein [Rhodospirillaceae bacterium]
MSATFDPADYSLPDDWDVDLSDDYADGVRDGESLNCDRDREIESERNTKKAARLARLCEWGATATCSKPARNPATASGSPTRLLLHVDHAGATRMGVELDRVTMR